MPTPVIEAVRSHFDLEIEIGGYEAEAQEHDRHQAVYDSVAALLNCTPQEVSLTSSATRAWSTAFYGMTFGRGDRILTARAEYGSNFIPFLQVAGRTGAVVETIPNDESGQVSVDALRSMVDERVKLIALTHVPTNGGLVNPAAAIGAVANETEIPYMLDACQSVGQLPIDVDAIGCDVLSLTSRKYLRGPRGIGALFVRDSFRESLDPPFLDIRSAEWISPGDYRVQAGSSRYEEWESNVSNRLGFGAAVDYALGLGLETIAHFVGTLAELFRERLADVRGVAIDDVGVEKCGIVSFHAAQAGSREIADALRAQQMNVSVSNPPATLLDARDRNLPDVVRASVHYYNTEREVDRFVDALRGVLRE